MFARHASSRLLACITVSAAFAGLASLSTSAMAQHDSHNHGATPHKTGAQQPAREGASKEIRSEPYPLDTCPVSGGKLGSMGDPVVKEYDGREVRFCCAGCIKKFEADKDGYWKKIDEKIIKAQAAFYPLTTCPISGEALGGDMGQPVDYVYKNRLVRFCCEGCIDKFLKNPIPTLTKIDEAVIKTQSKHYPVQKCLISGEAMGGDMGDPIDRVYANHLVRFCCKGCIKEFEKEPAKFLAELDAAWKQQGGLPAADHAAGHGADQDSGHGAHDGGRK